MNKNFCIVALFVTAIVCIACGSSPKVATEPITFFDGRVTFEVTTRVGGARPNDMPEYITFNFHDLGEYKVSFSDCEEGSAWVIWIKCPKKFTVLVDSGSREVVQKFDSLSALASSFTMKIDRNGEVQTCNFYRGNCVEAENKK